MDCYITRTGGYLPGEAINNEDISAFIGKLEGESDIKEKILRMNGIKQRHYALDRQQNPTHDVYDLATLAVEDCLNNCGDAESIGYLSTGTTNAPLVAPGLASILHSRLAELEILKQSIEINSNSGICTSAAQAIVNACRVVQLGEHASALSVGADQPSDILKSTSIKAPCDRDIHLDDIKNSKWFMSVFLRFMLSDGAGAFLIQDKPSSNRISFRVNWTHSKSFANEAPLCMKLENRTLLLSQDVNILNDYMSRYSRESVISAMEANDDQLGSYRIVLPHLSSYFFRRMMLKIMRELCSGSEGTVDYWTNLQTTGNTGAASIYLMLNEYIESHELRGGDKVLLFIPESGQFNFVIISLTVVR
ncbi:MAG: 3-oxoacyl-[acyl-carrier-protein] synthase III C-terminal domain-containing protein [Verrucomicrobiota bacterium]|nr:3-oxoacyl-[acyl-carrier-protein] synthase III C-terminal domain-containing protein [Verrucomicrobiota bacterium]